MKRGAPTKPAVIVLLLSGITLAYAQPSGNMKDESGPKEWVPGKGWVPAGSGTSDTGNYNGPGLFEALRKRSEGKRLKKQQEASEANDRGIEFAAKKDWANAIASYQISLAKEPNDPVVMKNLASAQARLANERGLTAYKNGDWTAAAEFFRQALKSNPYPEIRQGYVDNLAAAQSKLQTEQATLDMKKAIANLAEETKVPQATAKGAVASTGGLEFISGAPSRSGTPSPDSLQFMTAEARGAFGSKESGAKFATAAPHTPGSDTKAADQLVGAAAAAKHQGDLAINFDVGGARQAGTVAGPTVDGRYTAVDLSHFSERAKKDPEVVASLKNLTELQANRYELQTQREALTKQRATEKDPETMKKLTAQLEEKDTAYQANLAAITKTEAKIEKRHREIDNSGGEDAPAAAPAAPSGK